MFLKSKIKIPSCTKQKPRLGHSKNSITARVLINFFFREFPLDGKAQLGGIELDF